MTLNFAKLTNSRKDEDDEPTNQHGVRIGPDAKEARETAKKEFREGIKEETHQIIGPILFKLLKNQCCPTHTISLCSRNFQNVKLRSTIQKFVCHSILREINFGKNLNFNK